MSKEGRESYARDVARSARTPRSRGGTGTALPGGGATGVSGRTAKGEKVTYYYNPKTGKATYWVGSGKPSGSGWQDIGSTKPKGWVGGQARGVATDVDRGDVRIKALQEEGGYYYNPITKAISKQRVRGQRPMTKQEATYYKETYVEKGLSPYQTAAGKPLTTVEHKRIYEEELRARKDYEKYPYRMKFGGKEWKISSGMESKFRAASLAEAIRYGREKDISLGKPPKKEDVTVYRKGEQVTYRVGEHKPLKGWHIEDIRKGTKTKVAEIKKVKYEPTALGGLKLAYSKLKSKAKEHPLVYDAKQFVGLIPKGIKWAKGELKQDVDIQKVAKVKKIVKEHPLVYDVKQFAGLVPKGLGWAKGEFWPEIKTEAQRFKGIRDWNKDMKKIENVFLTSREGYVWAEEKAKGLELRPVKQPTFLKGVEPYKGFREQTKKQAVGVAQIGKVTMGATAGAVEDIRLKPWKLPVYYTVGVGFGKFAMPTLAKAPVISKLLGYGMGGAWAGGVGVEAAMTPAGLEREKKLGVRFAEMGAFVGGAKYGMSTTKTGKATDFLKELAKEKPPTTKVKQYYKWKELKVDVKSPTKHITKLPKGKQVTVVKPSKYVSSKYRISIPEPTVAVTKSMAYEPTKSFSAFVKGTQYTTIKRGDFFLRSLTKGGKTISKVYQDDKLLKILQYKTKPMMLTTEPLKEFEIKTTGKLPEYRMDIHKKLLGSKVVSLQKPKPFASWTQQEYLPHGRGTINIQQQLKAFTVKAKRFPYKKYKTTFTYHEGKPTGWDIASSQYKFVEHPVKPEKIVTIKAGKTLKVKMPVTSKTIQKTWIDQTGVIDWAKPSKWHEIRAHQYDLFAKPKLKETKIDKTHWKGLINKLNKINKQVAIESRAEKVSLLKKKVKGHVANIQNFLTTKAIGKIVKPVKYTPTIPKVSTVSSIITAPKESVGTFGLVKLGEKLGESFAEQYRSRERQEYKAKEKVKLRHKYKTVLKPKQVYVPKETYKLRQKPIQEVKQIPRQVAKQKYVYDIGLRVPTPTPTTWKIVEVPREPEIPPPPPLFKWPRGKLLPKTRKKKKFKPFHKYQPSLVAGFKKITAPKIPKRITGLGIRPVVRL